MKNLLKRTWWRAILVSLVIVLLSGGIVYAAYYGVSRTVAASATVAEVIILPSDAIGVYSDAAGTANVSSLNFGKVPPYGWGEYWRRVTVTVYVKNHTNTTGPEPVRLFINAYAQDFDLGNVWVDRVYNATTDRWEYPSLLPGEIKPLQINFGMTKYAPTGTLSFSVVIDGKAASAPDNMPPLMDEGKPVPVPVPAK